MLPGRALALSFLLLSASCTVPTKQAARQPLVRPTLEAHVEAGTSPQVLNQVVVFPLEQPPSASMRLAPDQLQAMTVQLVEALQARTSLQLVNIENPKSVSKFAADLQTAALPYAERAADFGRKVGAQGVLYGLVSEYTEAEPTKVGGSDRAAVSFRLWLFDVKRNTVVWNAAFTEENTPLSENLFRLGQAAKEGFRYLNANQLLDKGLSQAATELERVRKVNS